MPIIFFSLASAFIRLKKKFSVRGGGVRNLDVIFRGGQLTLTKVDEGGGGALKTRVLGGRHLWMNPYAITVLSIYGAQSV